MARHSYRRSFKQAPPSRIQHNQKKHDFQFGACLWWEDHHTTLVHPHTQGWWRARKAGWPGRQSRQRSLGYVNIKRYTRNSSNRFTLFLSDSTQRQHPTFALHGLFRRQGTRSGRCWHRRIGQRQGETAVARCPSDSTKSHTTCSATHKSDMSCAA